MSGAVVWITGLSGAGKSRVAGELARLLRQEGIDPVLLDGDELRESLRMSDTFTAQTRRQLAGTYGRLCRLLARQGHVVVCATISLQHSVHDWNRKHLPGYAEVFLNVPLEELRRRDPKGVYRAGSDVVGVDLAAELPLTPDVTIANHGAVSAEAAAAAVFAHCADRKLW
ncbi:adenylyl-sulfate kinase [Amycolatopsis acidiphila]|uniref:Adenylyl-sulfate kinase n=1 Tax=Amycolatopsis acidiphila TaxID=715473 RepID=A0A557ZPU3_9PSEU|nr:adenylyl-sulfate kinase [Amycolatopsis acidiphila]TVT14049.1 adenylyl-sulfate kinase [Amycolatopsis acidiphila]UIJ63607.1 adenylyl-sulfate kinase [Amycolatopsis acidiphila]GHG67966.1 hypothetical protein GCM10017788_27250 [Amycolatopsis acidiphila]